MSRLDHTATVLDYFNVIFGKNTIERTVEQTNMYVVQKNLERATNGQTKRK